MRLRQHHWLQTKAVCCTLVIVRCTLHFACCLLHFGHCMLHVGVVGWCCTLLVACCTLVVGRCRRRQNINGHRCTGDLGIKTRATVSDLYIFSIIIIIFKIIVTIIIITIIVTIRLREYVTVLPNAGAAIVASYQRRHLSRAENIAIATDMG